MSYVAVYGGKQRSRTPSLLREPGFQGQSQDHPRCITFRCLEHRVRFELTVLGICNPLRWASPPSVHVLVSVAGIEPTLERPKRSVIPFHHTEKTNWCIL